MNTFKKALSLFLTLAMLLSMVSMGVVVATAEAPGATATGQTANCYSKESLKGQDTWTDSNKKTWTVIETYDDLVAINGTAGRYILANDIDFAGKTTASVVKLKETTFFEGNGYAFTNINLTNAGNLAANHNGLFSLAGSVTISNLSLGTKDVPAQAPDCLVTRTMGSMCTVNWVNVDVFFKATRQGGNPAAFYSTLQFGEQNFTDCDVEVTYDGFTSGGNVAGFIAVVGKSDAGSVGIAHASFTNCTSTVKLTNNSVQQYIAGFVGTVFGGTNANPDCFGSVSIKNCTANGTITNAATSGIDQNAVKIENVTHGPCGVAGFVGSLEGTRADLRIEGSVNNVNLTTPGSRAGGFVSNITKAQNVFINNCTNNGKIVGAIGGGSTGSGGIIGIIWENSFVTVSNCTNKADFQAKQRFGGIVGQNRGDLYIYNCTNDADLEDTGAGSVGGILGYNNTGVVVIDSCTVKGNITGAQRAGTVAGQNNATMTILNPNLTEAKLVSYGTGKTADATNNMCSDQTGTLATEIVEENVITADTYEKDGVTYTVLKTVEDLLLLAEGGNFILGNSIDVSELEDCLVVAANTVLDGNGKSILHVDLSFNLFMFEGPVTVKNITFGSAHLPVKVLNGLVDGNINDTVNTTWENVDLYVTIANPASNASGFFGGNLEAGTHSFTGCNVTLAGGLANVNAQFGAYVGRNKGAITFTDCTANGAVYGTNAGGFIGKNSKGVAFINCTNNVFVYGANAAGFIGLSEARSTYDGCVNNGTVYGNFGSTNLGGFIGQAENDVVITNSVNNGKIWRTSSSTSYGAGFVGGTTNPEKVVIFANAENNGAVFATRAAGLVAQVDSKNLTVKNCANYGTITTDNQAGGLVGNANATPATVLDSVNVGNVTNSGNAWAAGIVYKAGAVVIERCTNLGTVTGGGAYTGQIVANAQTSLVLKDTYAFGSAVANNTTAINSQYVSNSSACKPEDPTADGNNATKNDDLLAARYVTAGGKYESKVVMYQGNYTDGADDYKIRLLALLYENDGVADVYEKAYAAVGFTVSAASATTTYWTDKDLASTKLYTAVNTNIGNATPKTSASEYGAEYFGAAVISGVPADTDVTFTITTYVTQIIDGYEVTFNYGATVTLTANNVK